MGGKEGRRAGGGERKQGEGREGDETMGNGFGSHMCTTSHNILSISLAALPPCILLSRCFCRDTEYMCIYTPNPEIFSPSYLLPQRPGPPGYREASAALVLHLFPLPIESRHLLLLPQIFLAPAPLLKAEEESLVGRGGEREGGKNTRKDDEVRV